MLKRTITITDGCASSYFAGYAGEHEATRLVFRLSDEFMAEGYSYLVSFELPNGTVQYANIAEPPVEIDLPRGLLLPGNLDVQLTVLCGKEVIYKTAVCRLRVADSITSLEDGDKYSGLIEDSIAQFNASLLAARNPVKINDGGSWEIYNITSGQYVDTGLPSRGDRGERGERGEQGVQGIQGLQGVPGAKGDKGEQGLQGLPGADGKDGADGYSPTATVTPTDSGAVVSITDINGTTTAQIHNGERGERGEDGKDYALTDTDKQEIADIVQSKNQWHLIRDITLDSDVNVISITTDEDGNSLNDYRHIVIYTYMTGAQGAKYQAMYVSVNDSGLGYMSNFVPAEGAKTYGKLHIELNAFWEVYGFGNAAGNVTPMSMQSSQQGRNKQKLSSVKLYTLSAVNFGSGSRLEIYGERWT